MFLCNKIIHYPLNVLKTVRHVNMLDGVVVAESKAQKDELILEGNDIDNVSQSGVYFLLSFCGKSALIFRSSRIYPWHLSRAEQGYSEILGRYLRVGEGCNQD